MSGSGKVVCVTGASGYIASWLVKLLLQRGYTIKGSVRDLNDPKKTEHLLALDGAKERLKLFKANLLVEGAFDAVVDGCEGVFHTASPCFFTTNDPQADLIDPAVKGTLNVLASCAKASSVKRVVLTSTMGAVVQNGKPRTPDVVVDEAWFSDPEFLTKIKSWYSLSKTLSEEAAWKFGNEKGIDIVTINPGTVLGPLLQPTLNATSALILDLINGTPTFPNMTFGWVHMKDVAEAHILAFEVPSARGRYCLVESVAHFSDIVKILQKLYPDLPFPENFSFFKISSSKDSLFPQPKISQRCVLKSSCQNRSHQSMDLVFPVFLSINRASSSFFSRIPTTTAQRARVPTAWPVLTFSLNFNKRRCWR